MFANGEDWEKRRKCLSPTLLGDDLKDYFPVFVDIGQVRAASNNGDPYNGDAVCTHTSDLHCKNKRVIITHFINPAGLAQLYAASPTSNVLQCRHSLFI